MTESLIQPDSYINFKNNKVTFITFNYDRSLEHFLYESLLHSYGDKNDIVDQVKAIPVLHVYGKIADLPWENNSNKSIDYFLKSNMSPYEKISFEQLKELIKNILTIHDFDSKKHDQSNIIEIIKKAERLFFLGFGFAQENMKTLGLSTPQKGKKIFATAYGYLEEEINNIKRTFDPRLLTQNDLLYGETKVDNTNCKELLRKYL